MCESIQNCVWHDNPSACETHLPINKIQPSALQLSVSTEATEQNQCCQQLPMRSSLSVSNVIWKDNPIQVKDRNHAGASEHGNLKLNWVQNRLKIKNKAGQAALKDSSQDSFPQCTVQYTCYGEVPPWYTPGRMCTLELIGDRVLLPQFMPLVAKTKSGSQI